MGLDEEALPARSGSRRSSKFSLNPDDKDASEAFNGNDGPRTGVTSSGRSEKAGSHPQASVSDVTAGVLIDPNDPGELRVAGIRQSNRALVALRRAEEYLDRRLGLEAMGVERIPDDKRSPPQVVNMMLFWFSMLFQPVLIPIGMLGPEFGLSVNTSVALTVTGCALGTMIPAFTATLSPKTGLRQIAVSRYSFGIWGAKICGLLNIVVNIGYGTISAVLGGQLLAAVSEGSLPLALGIVIISVCAFAISFLGFAVIHTFERYAWFVAFVIICVLWGQAAPHFSPTPNFSELEGIDYSGACLTYFAIVFGIATSWAPIAGDYYVHYPARTSPWLIFILTFLGQLIPTIFVIGLGNYLGGIISTDETFGDVYNEGGIGGFLLAVFTPYSWARAACVLFFLSLLGNVVANIYSAALSVQLWSRHFIAVPRSVWCLFLAIILLALALGGRDELEAILQNLLSLLGYWTTAFGLILFVEHFVFRPRLGGYDVTAWQDHGRMPVGVAGTGTLLICIGLSFLGMNQTWYVSPGAKAIGASGGDIGDYIIYGAVFILYPIMRFFEIKYTGR